MSLSRSRHALGQATLDTVLLHRAAELNWQNGTVWTALRRRQERGLIHRLGVSVQSPDELDAALAAPGVSHIQLPFNLLDDCWTARLDGLREVRAKRGVTVHVRSALLQGLLTSHDRQLWARAGCADTAVVAAWLADEAARLTRRNVIDLCLAYVRSLDWADGIVVGVNSLAQLHDTLNLFSQPPLSPAEAQHVERSRPRIESRVLDPATWAAPTA